jgi:antitoxin component HigA of HigAB toxin-antitoxin module
LRAFGRAALHALVGSKADLSSVLADGRALILGRF